MISKDKIMLQIPVRKELAKSWKNLLKETKTPAEVVFTAMYVQLLHSISGKGGDQNGESKENNSEKA